MSGEERTVLFQLPTVISGQLACTQGTVAGRSFPLSAGTFVIGRQEGCDLVLAREPGVSKLHAKIIAESGHYEVVDCESRNGTLLNGRPVQTARLRSGDEIRICDCVLRFTQTGGDFSGPSSISPPLPAPRAEPAAPAEQDTVARDDAGLRPVEPPVLMDAQPAPRVGSALPWFFAGLVVSVVGVFGLAFGLSSATAGKTSGADGAVRVNRVTAAGPGHDVALGEVPGVAAPTASTGEGAHAAASAVVSGDGVEGSDGARGRPTEPEAASATPGPAAVEPVDEAEPPSVAHQVADKGEAAERLWYAAEVQPARPVIIKVRSEVTVAQVLGKEGAEVRRGELLLMFEDREDDEVANLRANIEALEVVAESQPSAAETLEVERGKLRRLLARRGDNKLAAPAAGVLQAFDVEVGSRLAAGDKVGQILAVGSTLRAVLEQSASTQGWRRGERVVLRSRGSTSVGKILSVQDKGERLEVAITTRAALQPPVEVALP